MAKKVKQKVSKVNNTKVINKKLGKAAKRGKLKGKAKQKLFQIREVRQKAGLKKRAKIAADWEEQRHYKNECDAALAGLGEVTPADLQLLEQQHSQRNQLPPTHKPLLPIKTAKGHVLPQFDTAEPSESEAEGSGDEDEQEAKAAKPKSDVNPSLTDLAACKTNMASLCQHILQDPERSMSRLKCLLNMISGSALPVASLKAPVSLLAIASTVEVLIDIIPGYRIRPQSEKSDEDSRLKKETMQLVQYEQDLLRHYTTLLQTLEAIALATTRKQHLCSPQHRALAAECLARMACQLAHFNYSANLIALLARLAALSDCDQVRAPCLRGLSQLFGSDQTGGQATLEAVRCINKIVAVNVKRIQPDLLHTLTALRIKEVERNETPTGQQQDKRKRSKQLQTMNKKAKKFHKQLDKLENELKETDARNSRERVLKLNTLTMSHVFHIYFRVLKRMPRSKLLRPCLDGLSRFAHLINVDFYDDLVACLYQVVDTQNLHVLDSLHAVHCVFTVLSGEAASINIDPSCFYRCVYRLLPLIALESNKELQARQWDVCLRCLDLMLVQRRKQINVERTLACCKRLSLLCVLLTDVRQLRAVLSAVRCYALTHSRVCSAVALDEDDEAAFGFGYSPAINDPDHAGAHAALFKELSLFSAHPDAVVQRLVNNIKAGCPVHGPSRLPPDMANKKPWQFVSTPIPVGASELPQSVDDLRKRVLTEFNKKISAEIRRQEDYDVAEEEDGEPNVFKQKASLICALIQSNVEK